MTNDLISRSALLKKARRYTEFDEAGFSCPVRAVEAYEIENAPAVDAVEVVRCKDCQAYSKNPWSDSDEMVCKCWCSWIPTDPDDFCSYGERRADDGK